MGLIEDFISAVKEAYDLVIGIFPGPAGQAVNVFVIAILVAVVSLFIWYFYRSLSQRNLISLNLGQYNNSEHPAASKTLALLFYFLEYIIIMPFLIGLWFAALAVFILVIASERSVAQVLMLTAALVAAVRILAYSNSEISRDLAKLFPFITLSVFLLTPGSFDLNNLFGKFSELPVLITSIFYFIFVIFAVEIILRVIYTIRRLFADKFGEGVAVRRRH